MGESVESVEPVSAVETETASGMFVGCYKDTRDRDLPARQANFATGDREVCFKQCSDMGYKFAGLQWKGQCFWGNDYGKYGKGDECNCERGSKDFGFWHQCIYQVAEFEQEAVAVDEPEVEEVSRPSVESESSEDSR